MGEKGEWLLESCVCLPSVVKRCRVYATKLHHIHVCEVMHKTFIITAHTAAYREKGDRNEKEREL